MTRLPRRPTGQRAPRSGTPWWRWLITIALALGVFVALNFYFAADSRNFAERLVQERQRPGASRVVEEVPTAVTALSDYEERRLAAQRERAEALARRHVGSVPRRERFDLEIVQEILDRADLTAADRAELEALGVALGDVLAAEHGMRWVEVSDRYGRTAALRYRSDDNLFFPVTWISKRVEAGLDVDVATLYRRMEDIVADIDRAEGRG